MTPEEQKERDSAWASFSGIDEENTVGNKKVMRTDIDIAPEDPALELPSSGEAVLIGAGKKLTDFAQGAEDAYYQTRSDVSGEGEMLKAQLQSTGDADINTYPWMLKQQEIADKRAHDLPYYEELQKEMPMQTAVGEALPFVATAPLSGGAMTQTGIGAGLELAQYGQDNMQRAIESGGISGGAYVAGSTIPRLFRMIKGGLQGAGGTGVKTVQQILGADETAIRNLQHMPVAKTPVTPMNKQRGSAGFGGSPDDVIEPRVAGTNFSSDINPQLDDYTKELLTRSDEIGFKMFPSAKSDSHSMEQVEISAKSLPFLSDLSENMVKQNQEILNGLALKSIGEEGGRRFTPQIFGKASKRIGAVYENLARGKVIPIYQDDLMKVLPDLSQKGEELLNRYIKLYPEMATGKMTGKQFNRLRNRISADIRLQNKAPDGVPEDLMLIQSKLDRGLFEVNPKAKDELIKAGKQWRNLKVLERTNAVGIRGNVNPQTVASGLRQSDKGGFLRGRNTSDYYDAIRLGQAYPEAMRVPPAGSNTATKSWLLKLASNPESVIGGALLRKPYGKYLEGGTGQGTRTALGLIGEAELEAGKRTGSTAGKTYSGVTDE